MRFLALVVLVLPGWLLTAFYLTFEYHEYGLNGLIEHIFSFTSPVIAVFHVFILMAPIASTSLGAFVADRFRLMDSMKALSEKYMDYYEHAPYGYHSVGPDMVFLDINDMWLEMFGYEREEVVGRMKAVDLLPVDLKAESPKLFARLKDKGGFQNVELEFLRKDGSRMPVLVSSSSVFNATGDFVRSRTIVKDDTERRQMEDNLRTAADTWEKTFSSMPWGVALLDKECKILNHNQYFKKESSLSPDKLFSGHCRTILKQAEAEGKPRVQEHYDQEQDRHFSLSVNPMGNGGGYVASVVDVTEMKLGQKKLKDSRDAFFNMLKDASEAYKDLEAAHSELIVGLANAIDAKSAWTKGHSERVTRYALVLGEEVGLGQRDLSRLRTAALLHDIGKIGTYDALLDKPSGLSRDEFEHVKCHPEKAVEILKPIGRFAEIIDAVKHHHERWDGKGYPEGLKGRDIPFLARILCVADSFDSMTADRPYRSAQSRHFALKELNDCSGTHFDPELTEIFMQLIQDENV